MDAGRATRTLQRAELRRRGQRGNSLIEVVVAIVLFGSIILALSMAFFTVNRTTVSNERVQMVDAALLSYGEIIRSQINYRPCRPDYNASHAASDYQDDTGFYITGNTGPGPGAIEEWLQPPAVIVELEAGGVDSWDLENSAFVNGCLIPDTGVQLISYKVTYNPIILNPELDPDGAGAPIVRTGQVVKRLPGPS